MNKSFAILLLVYIGITICLCSNFRANEIENSDIAFENKNDQDNLDRYIITQVEESMNVPLLESFFPMNEEKISDENSKLDLEV
jgi:hypothetical protein